MKKKTKTLKQNIWYWFWNTSTRLVKQLWQSIFGGLSFHNFDFYTNLACVSRGFFEITTTIWCLSGNANWQNLDTLWCQPNHQLSRCTSESRNLVTASMTFLILRRALRSRSRNISNFLRPWPLLNTRFWTGFIPMGFRDPLAPEFSKTGLTHKT